MFDWLEEELLTIKTPKFHLVDGPADLQLQHAVERAPIDLPWSYKEFVLRFGNAKLYRNARNNSYRVGIFAAPRVITKHGKAASYQIGFHDGATVFVKQASVASFETPIFEFESGVDEKVADSFDEWLTNCCSEARNKYGPAEWAELVRGPKPFNEEEMQIIESRRHVSWAALGTDKEENQVIEVTNASERTFSSFTIGVRSKNGKLNGAVRLDLKGIGPGTKGIVKANCYKGLVAPHELELFSLPDPKPEDRAYYWEFETQ